MTSGCVPCDSARVRCRGPRPHPCSGARSLTALPLSQGHVRRPLGSVASTCLGVSSVTTAGLPHPWVCTGRTHCSQIGGGVSVRGWEPTGRAGRGPFGIRGWSTAGDIGGGGGTGPLCVLRDGRSHGLGASKADVDVGVRGAVFRGPPCAARKRPRSPRCSPDPRVSSACGWRVSPWPWQPPFCSVSLAFLVLRVRSEGLCRKQDRYFTSCRSYCKLYE